MTVSSTASRWEFDGNGATLAFPFDNRIFDAADLKVYVGGALQALTTDYTVSGIDNPSGGAVTFLAAPPAGTKNVVIVRDVPATQTTAYPPGDKFPAASHEKALDKLTVLIQQGQDAQSRSLQLPPTVSGIDLTLPAPTARRALLWNSDGDGIENSASDPDEQVATATAAAGAAAGAAATATAAAGAAQAAQAGAEASATDAAASAAAALAAVGQPADGSVTFGKLAAALLPSQSEAQAGTVTNKIMSPKNVADAVAAQVARAPVRQTVLSGAVDASGMANFLSAGSGLSVNLAATATPVVVAFAAGFGGVGAVDYVSMITADVASAWSGLPADRKIYLCIDRNTSTGELFYGFTLLAPVYGYGITKSTVAYQYTYRIDEGVMYVGNGSAATAVQRVFVGECVTGPASVTSVTTYALQGRYDSGWFAVSASTTYAKTHAIGVANTEVAWEIAQNSDGSGWRFAGANNNFEPGSGGSVFSATALSELSQTALNLRTGSFLQNAQNSAGTSIRVTSGYARATAKRGW